MVKFIFILAIFAVESIPLQDFSEFYRNAGDHIQFGTSNIKGIVVKS